MSFFSTDPATTEIYTLSLHDALPISLGRGRNDRDPKVAECRFERLRQRRLVRGEVVDRERRAALAQALHRSEEHTSELQSHSDLVCRLLLEKKKKKKTRTYTKTKSRE